MSIQINNNFDYKGNQPNFERDRFETLELMRSADERSLDNGHISYCEETGKHYVFNENNDIDVETGKWRLLIENPENLDTNKQDKTDNALDTTDKTVVGAINEINGNALDNVTFSADYKNIIINRKSGLNPYTIPIASIINNAKITELNDVDSTDIGDGKTLVYDGATQKHKYVSSTGTDELVKMDSTTDAKYLSDLIDKSTVVNDNGVLKVKKLDGQEVTIAEINHLKGLTMNVMDLVNAFANGGVKVYERTIPTYADLLALDRSGFIDGIKYFVYIQSDETHGGAKTTYICDKNSTSYFCVSGDHRDFITNPIDLVNEVTGKLGTSNIDVDALWKLLTINDTYKTLTTKDEVFGTRGAKALYDELVADIGKKANATDLTSHTSDTNIHVTTSDKTKWNKVDNKVDKANITTTIGSSSTDTQVPSAKSVYDNIIKDKLGNLGIDHTYFQSDSMNVKLTHFGAYKFGNPTKGVPSDNVGDWVLINIPWNINDKSNFTTTMQYANQLLFSPRKNDVFWYRIVWNYNESSYTYTEGDYNVFRKWNKICMTSVTDVPRTQIKLNNGFTGTIIYEVKNGICYINADAFKSEKTGEDLIVSDTLLPKPSIGTVTAMINFDRVEEETGMITIIPILDNRLRMHCYRANTKGWCTFSYPVAES